MRRGTTPEITFKVNLDLTQAQIYITFVQRNNLVFEKTTEDLEITANAIKCTLTQKETLALKKDRIQIQIRYIFRNGTAGASNIMYAAITDILKDGEIIWN